MQYRCFGKAKADYRKMENKLSKLKYWLMYRLIPKHKYHLVRTGLAPGYYDIDQIMLHANMALLCRYVENQCNGEAALEKQVKSLLNDAIDAKDDNGLRTSLNQQAHTDVTALVIYRWWKYEWKKEWNEYDAALADRYSGEMTFSEPDDIDGTMKITSYGENPNAKMTVEELWDFEKRLQDKEQEMLKCLIDLRFSLWT